MKCVFGKRRGLANAEFSTSFLICTHGQVTIFQSVTTNNEFISPRISKIIRNDQKIVHLFE